MSLKRIRNIFWCFLMLTIMIDRNESLRPLRIISGIPETMRPFQKITSQSEKSPDLPTMPKSVGKLKSAVQCMACRASLNFLLRVRRSTTSVDRLVKKIARNICVHFVVYHKEVCEGVIALNWDILTYVVTSQPKLDVDMMCRFLLNDPKCEDNNNARHNWQIKIDDRRPKDTEVKPIVSNDPAMTIIHISDLHYDPNYKAGAPAVCGVPACCRIKQGKAKKRAEAAGKWGDYRYCDAPWIAIVDTYEQIKKQHKKIDAMYFTGDIVDHGAWETTIEGNKESIRKTMRKLKEIFGDVMVLPVLGNHESQPVNIFSPKNAPEAINTQWLYDFVAEEWSYWLPESTKETIKQGGYYTVLVKPGFRVIALNNNVISAYNWWLYLDPTFIREQLQWLHDTLLRAERDNEIVHILAHIPSGENENFYTWDREYGRIVERFSGTIKAQFNGHMHKDEFKIFYASSSSHKNSSKIAINVAFNGGSVTAYSHGNPNYKVYEVEPQTFKVLDHHTWTYNLTAANLAGGNKKPEWYKLYSFKQDFGVKSVDPIDLDKLAQKLAKDQQLARKYFEFSDRQGNLKSAKECDGECLQAYVCRIGTTIPFDHSWCDEHIPKSNSRKRLI